MTNKWTKKDTVKLKEEILNCFRTYNIGNSVIDRLEDMGFFKAPASTKYHGAYEGGLMEHSWAVANTLCDLSLKLHLEWKRHASPFIIGMFHDLCKCDQYVWDAEQDHFVWNKTLIGGHGEKSIMYLSQLMTLTDEEIYCIRYHMGAFSDDPEERSRYSAACEKYPNVLWTHTADMFASHILLT